MECYFCSGKRPILVFAALLFALLLPAPAWADPYPTDVTAEVIDGTTVRITWGPNAWAESYRIHRNNTGTIAQVPPDVTEYLDTGLTTGMPYYYMVASMVDGTAHWAVTGGALVMPIEAPTGITSLSWHKVTDYIGDEYLGIELAWTPVEGVIGYEIFARTGLAGEFIQKTECIESSVLTGFPLPTVETTYFFKVHAAMEFYVAEADEYDYFTGPFSPEASITVPAAGTIAWKTLGPLMTLQPPIELFPMKTLGLHIPSLTFLPLQMPSPPPPVTLSPQMKTKAPAFPAITNLIPMITPAPTPFVLMPIRTNLIPIMPVQTLVPVQTVVPKLKIRP